MRAAAQAVQNLVRKYQENYVESEESGEREFWVAFYNLEKDLKLRELKTHEIGRLVRPLCVLASTPAPSLCAAHGIRLSYSQLSGAYSCWT